MREYLYVRFANAILVGPSVDPLTSLSAGESGTGFREASFCPDPDMPNLFLRVTCKNKRGDASWVQLVPWAQVTSISFKDHEAPVASPFSHPLAGPVTPDVANQKTPRKRKTVA